MSATDSTSKYSAKRRILYGFTTGGLLLGGIGMAAAAQADTSATGATADSPGVASGNLINIPVNLPINLCGDTLNVIGIGDSAHGNNCSNESGSGESGSTTATGSASNSPGVGSGNLINIPVNIPVNLCGDTLSVIGIGNTAHGNNCSNESGTSEDTGGTTTATGSATHSPGVGSGNLINIPVNIPVNACGDSVNVIGVGNTTHGNDCTNEGPGTGGSDNCGCAPTPPPPPPVICPPPVVTPPAPPAVTTPPAPTEGHVAPTGTLASTGSGAMAMAPLGLGLLGGGGYLTRRGLLKSPVK